MQEEEQEEKELGFLDHLEELRWHLVRSLIAIVVFAVVAFAGKSFFFGELILGPSRLDFWTYRMLCKLGELLNTAGLLCIEELPFIIQSRQMTGQFTMHITSSVVIGIIIAFPYIFWEVWRFISPGLNATERSLSRGAVFFVSVLFAFGVLFGYYIISPLSINFLSNYQLDPSISNEFDIISYVSTITMLVLSCAIMFQLPVVVFFLTRAGFVGPETLKTYWRHAFVGILLLSAILTPPDLVSQLLISLPLFLLYRFSIVISKMVVKKKAKELKRILDENS
ncbi:MAG: twin-arginine translocase subunit TatC [Cyclobacteriaceae bacterium]|nr:twin-arginine translocase subunit TatC [Cyclobacteriaceae bacterium]